MKSSFQWLSLLQEFKGSLAQHSPNKLDSDLVSL
jgi:hypothetical protein